MPANRFTDWRATARIMAWSPLHAAPGRASRPALRATSSPLPPGPVLALAGQLGVVSPSSSSLEEVVQLVGVEGVLRAPQREVHLEDGLEGPPVGVVLHQRGAERVLERLTILDRDVLHRLHGVEVLGEADRQTRPRAAPG